MEEVEQDPPTPPTQMNIDDDGEEIKEETGRSGAGTDDDNVLKKKRNDMVKLKLGRDGEVVEEEKDEEEQEHEGEREVTLLEKARKAAVAVSGGAMVVVGIPLIPFPAPFGVPLVAGGLTVLASEFPAAQRVLDEGKDKLRNFAEHEEEEEEEAENGVEVRMVDDLGLGFEIVKDNNSSGGNNRKNTDSPSIHSDSDYNRNIEFSPKKTLRAVTRNQILPVLDFFSPPKKRNSSFEILEEKNKGEEKSNDFYQKQIF